MNRISNLIIELSKDPFNPGINFDCAEEYLRNNQTASAVSFYLRCVEYDHAESPLGYASLLRMAQCFDNQRGREFSVTNCLLQAVAYDDTRPEAYWMLSRFHEQSGSWQESYTFATIALGWSHGNDELPADFGFYGTPSVEFQLALAAYWIGRKSESHQRFLALDANPDLPEVYQAPVKTNLEKLNEQASI